jgi:ribosome-associated protein
MQIISIESQPIELCKLLKIANLVSGGGEAKIVISEGYVLVNDLVEYQKRKKIYVDDVVEFNGEKISVKLSAAEQSKPVKLSTSPKHETVSFSHQDAKKTNLSKAKTSHAKATDSSKHTEQTIEPARKKRKPISF